MIQIAKILSRFTITDYARLTEQAERIRQINNRTYLLEEQSHISRSKRTKHEATELLRLNRPEYLSLKNALRKIALYKKHIAFNNQFRKKETK